MSNEMEDHRFAFGHSSLDVLHSFVIGHWSFVIHHSLNDEMMKNIGRVYGSLFESSRFGGQIK
jgi:hypothetical protein